MTQLAIRATSIFAAMTAVVILAFAMVMTVSAQSDDPDWKVAPTGLVVATGDAAGKLDLTWDAHPQTSKTLQDYRVTWAPDGEAFRPNSETEWYAYPTTNQVTVTDLDAGETYKVRVRARYDDNKKSHWSNVVTGQAAVTPNSPATGQPTISGTAEVGETLTAGTSAISDANGLTNAVFNHQWARSNDGSHTDISGATSASYVITSADAESKIKVRVSFTDDDGYAETLISASTASIPAQSQNQPRQAATDATLSGLEVEGAGGKTITLSPEFASGTTAYTATIVNRIDSVTLSATKNDANATVVITSDDDDATPGEAELDLSVGANALTVTVTAADASTLTYTITATRATAPPAPTDCPADTDWCATLVLGYNPISSAQFTTEQFGYFSDSNYGDLSSATFSHGGISYTVSTIFRVKVTRDSDSVVQTDNITFTVSPELPNGTVLQLDTRTFTVDADSEGTSTGQEQWDIKADPPVWTDGQHVTVSLKLPATLSTLSIIGTTNGETVDLNPPFDKDTFTYTAAFPIGIDAVTLTAKTDVSDATVAITGDSDTSTPDTADFDLILATNTLTVTTTAQHGYIQTYTVTILPAQTTVPPDWSLKPSGVGAGQQFRLIFLSSTKSAATSTSISTYNTFVQNRAADGHSDIKGYSSGFTVVGCTADVDARDNTATRYTNANKGVPIYWLNGNKVADNYEDFYDETWDEEANDKNQLGTIGPDTSQEANYPYTGCAHNGTESFDVSFSYALGDADGVRVARPNSTLNQHGPLSSNLFIDPSGERPMYGLSQVFTVVPGNTGTLTTGGTPRSDTLDSSDTGHYWQVRLHQNVKYRIDVKGSESSQYGGTITNPRIQVIAGSPDIQILNSNSSGVYQTMTTTVATGGGAGHNSRLDIKVTGETKYYFLLVHRGTGDDGSYTLTVNRLDWPQGRLAPDITVNVERFPAIGIQWDEPAKTHHDIRAPMDGYKVQYRTLPNGTWETEITKNLSQRSHEITGMNTQGQKYEVRVRSYHTNEHPNNTYRWGYATVYNDDCEDERADICSIDVNQTKNGRINYERSPNKDIDGYTVDLVSGRTYVIRVNGKSTSHGTLVDPHLELFRGEDNKVASNDNGGSGLNSKLTYTPASTEDYLIKVSSSVAGERGTYMVKVTEQ